MKSKKSQGLPINIIIIAVISLIVLIVLVAIFTGYAGNWSRSFMGSCQDQGGICSDKGGSPGECNNQDFPRKVFAKGCNYYEREWVRDYSAEARRSDETIGEYKYTNKGDKKQGQCCLPT